MNIVVCVKQVLDPDIPAEKFIIKANQVVPPEGIPSVINPYDANAVEAALRLKDKYGGKITAITLGTYDAQNIIKRTLALGVDEGFVVSDEAFLGSDDVSVAYILAQAIRKISNYNLILCGREAADWSMGLVGPLIAENLGLPVITLAKCIELLDNKILKIERVILDGYQIFEVSLPALITVGSEIGLLRLPKGMGIIKAARTEIPVWSNKDINADSSLIGSKIVRSRLLHLTIPKREKRCEIISGESPTETGAKLVMKLKENGLL